MAAPAVASVQTNISSVEVLTQTEPTAYPEPESLVIVGLVVAVRLFRPPDPPLAAGKYPLTEVARLIGGELPVVPSCECPVLAAKAACNWLNSELSGGAVIFAPLIMSATDCLVYPAISNSFSRYLLPATENSSTIPCIE